MKQCAVISVVLSLLFFSGACSKQDWSKKEDVPIKVSSNMNEDAELGNTALHVFDARLRISSLYIEGKRLQGDDVSISFQPNTLVDLKNGEKLLNVELPIGTYDDLKITIDYTGNDGMIKSKVIKTNGNQNELDMDIPLVYENKVVTFDILQNNNKDIITVGEDEISISIQFDLQKTMEGVGNGPWNGLITANQAQNNVDLTTVIGKNFLTNFKSQLIEKSRVILK